MDVDPSMKHRLNLSLKLSLFQTFPSLFASFVSYFLFG